jgi:hypothetical protein
MKGKVSHKELGGGVVGWFFGGEHSIEEGGGVIGSRKGVMTSVKRGLARGSSEEEVDFVDFVGEGS